MSIYNPYKRPDFHAIYKKIGEIIAAGAWNRDGSTTHFGEVPPEIECLIKEYEALADGTGGVRWSGWEGMLSRWKYREKEESTEIFLKYVEAIGDEDRLIQYQEILDRFIDECGHALVKKHGGMWVSQKKAWYWADEPWCKRGVSLKTYRQYTVHLDELRSSGAGWCVGESRTAPATIEDVVACVETEMMGRPY
jgi:hypothetical protein